ncbi:MAG TPA: hypothetical protein VE291_05605, partial [Terracidiphilus sp.]|nr:hypothetical protein [Terracidiphilus sp.]
SPGCGYELECVEVSDVPRAKALSSVWRQSARLKPCPFKTTARRVNNLLKLHIYGCGKTQPKICFEQSPTGVSGLDE